MVCYDSREEIAWQLRYSVDQASKQFWEDCNLSALGSDLKQVADKISGGWGYVNFGEDIQEIQDAFYAIAGKINSNYGSVHRWADLGIPVKSMAQLQEKVNFDFDGDVDYWFKRLSSSFDTKEW